MPQPTQREDESDDEFVQRCMSDDVMKRDYPKKEDEKFPEQRYAVCNRLADNEDTAAEGNQNPEDGDE